MESKDYRHKNALFLDRDGVINKRIVDGYVDCYEQFEFESKALEALAVLSHFFEPIIVVTNQQGIGKGLMTEQDFDVITQKMIADIKNSGGRIDKVFHCPDLAQKNSFNRKPNVGMGLKARRIFPSIRFKQSLMVGDAFSDMVFGKRLKMKCVLIADSPLIARREPKFVDMKFDNLYEFAKYIENEKKN
ncbi:MAG: HAD-IIIA family hydrolase [Bacteroidales bacterium]|jgi:histidinol-phosphate phosphatase family protein|nr:HAD-IIIA family hydrolase [Bacteroidales bacterium]